MKLKTPQLTTCSYCNKFGYYKMINEFFTVPEKNVFILKNME